MQSLESRVLLSTSPYISEFMASNDNTLLDQDGQSSDWIEIANPSLLPVSLNGYYLTDNPQELAKWQFPDVQIPAGGYLVVFASQKDRAIAGSELHTNFSLDAGDGEYLALVAPDGQTVVSQYAPAFPRQLTDVSYGIGIDYETTLLLGAADNVRVLIPGDGNLGLDWTQRQFSDTAWMSGPGGVGFDADVVPPPVSGFTVRMVDVVGGITDVYTAQSLLARPLPGGYTLESDTTKDYSVVNFGDTQNFAGNLLLPNGLQVTEQYVLHVTANLFIPGGTWSINVGSDDGFKLVIPGVTFTNRVNENTGGMAVVNDTLVYSPPRGHQQTSASFTVPAQGLSTTLSLVFYENGGGDSLELSVASGTQSFNSNFVLLSDNVLPGWRVTTTSSTPPPDFNPLIGTSVQSQMFNRNGSAYVRIPLRQVDNPADFDSLRLRIRYDDGFIAYLNGTEIARRNAPANAQWNSVATADHPDAQSLLFETIDVLLPPGLLNVGAGTNVLAIHGLNQSATDTDFLIGAEVYGVRTLDQAPRYFTNPTPGAANDASSITEVVADTKFSHDRGFYDAPFAVTITTATVGATIRYTLDGSQPTATTGLVYSGPITINTTTTLRAAAFKPGAISTDVDTQTYIFLNDVIHQPNNPPGFPTTGIHWDYEMDPDVVNNPAYSSLMIDALKQIPSISLVSSVENIFGPNGIYTNPGGTGVTWERPASAELINPDGSQGFQINAGLRIYGGVNRSTSFPKHTFRLLFKDQYGAGKLRYPLFKGTVGGENAVEEFDTLVLRGAFNNSWPFWVDSERNRAQYVHDPFSYTTQLAMGQPSIHGRFIHLYVNGLYWGLYNIVERPSADYGASYFGGTDEDYDALNSSEPIDGTKDAWNTLQNLAAAGITTPEQYAQIQQYVDIDNLIDYMILNMYGGNWDWDDHNWYAMRKREPGAGYMFFSWDAERTLEGVNDDRTEVNQWDKPSYIYARLRSYPEFRLRFADRVQKHFFNGGALTPENALARYWSLANQIDKAVIAESARWGDWARQTPYTRNVEWINEQNRLVTSYFPQRTGVVLNQFKADGLYPALNAPVFAQHGGPVPPGFSLTVTAAAGAQIWYTLDGSDPRLAGGGISPTAIRYTAAIPIPGTTQLKARAFDGETWSALNEAVFFHQLSALRVTEIMYNPPAGGSFAQQEYEFIELQNIGATALDLTGVGFTVGLTYQFPNGTQLAPGARTVLIKNLAAFQSRYPDVPVSASQVYTGSLDNNGERLVLSGPGGALLDFEYKDGWYNITDGGGYSLVVVNPAAPPASYAQKQNWRPSNNLNGKPGGADPGYAPGSVVISELMTHTDQPIGDWIELYNTTSQDIPIGGWYLSDSSANLKKYRIPDGIVIEAGKYLVFNQRDHFGKAGGPGVNEAFGFSELGEAAFLTSNDGPTDLGGYREDADFGAAANEVTFGRHIKSTGGKDIVAMSAPTMGQPNALPLVGPIVINEIMYHPAGTGHEFIELLNLTGSHQPLYDPLNPANRWKFTEAIDYTFPAGATLPPFGYALVVGIDPGLFRSTYAIPEIVPIFGPWVGMLDNAGENLKLAKPGIPQPDGFVPYITVDQINYKREGSWPTAPDGTGPSLTRLSATAYGNDAANWVAGPPGGSPGAAFIAPAAPVELTAVGLSGASIRLTWADMSTNENGFQIERSSNGITFTLINTVGAGVTSYDDLGGLQPGTFYTYRVRAFNNAGTSAWSNAFSAATFSTTTLELVPIDATWRYNESRTDLGTAWIASNYDDRVSPWKTGQALLYAEDATLPVPKVTPLTLGPSSSRTPTFYFRIEFNLDVEPSNVSALQLRTIIDDGAAFYLNGNPTPAFTLGMPATWNYGTYAARTVGDATWEGPFNINTGYLVRGRNVLAAEVKQVNSTSSDVVFGASLHAILTTPNISAQIAPVTPDPRTEPVDSLTISFSEPVTGLDLSDLRLTRDNGANLLTAAQTLSTPDGGKTWTLANLASLTAGAGNYSLMLLANGSGISGLASGRLLGADAVESFRVSPTTVQGTPLADALYIQVNGENIEVFKTIPPSGNPAYVIPWAGIATLTLDTGFGDDAIHIAGALPVKLILNGGGGNDRLTLGTGTYDFKDDLGLTLGIEELIVGGNASVSFTASQHLSSLGIENNGRVSLTPGGNRVLRTGSLSIAQQGVLDLGAHAMIVQAPPGTAASVRTSVASSIASGRNGGSQLWTGKGILSSLAQSNPDRTLGLMLNGKDGGGVFYHEFAGEEVDANSVLVRYTWNGDADLNGRLNADDYFRIDKGFFLWQNGQATEPTFRNGNFDYDDSVSIDDYILIDAAMMSQLGGGGGGSGVPDDAATAPVPAAAISTAPVVGISATQARTADIPLLGRTAMIVESAAQDAALDLAGTSRTANPLLFCNQPILA